MFELVEKVVDFMASSRVGGVKDDVLIGEELIGEESVSEGREDVKIGE